MEETAIQAVETNTEQQNEVTNEIQNEGVQDGMQNEGQETAQEVKPEAPKDDPLPKGVQKRIDRAVKRQYEAEAKANELERRLQQLEQQERPAQVRSTGEPKLEQFDNIEDYVSAKARYIAKQELTETLSAREKAENERNAQAAQSKSAESWQKRVMAAQSEMSDYNDVVGASDIVFKEPAVVTAIQDSDIGPKIAYYLATHTDEADDIADMTGLSAIRAIGRLEAKLQTKTVATTKTPAPITPVGGKAKIEKDPGQMSSKEFDAWRKGYISSRGSR